MCSSICLQGEILSLEIFSAPKTRKTQTHLSVSETIKTNPLQIYHSLGTVRGQMLGAYQPGGRGGDIDGSI